MKIAIIYYSLDGNTALIAQTIKEILSSAPFNKATDLFEIKLLDTKKRSGFIKFCWALGQMIWNKKPAIQPLSVDTAAYDLFILGTPVWGSSPAPALASFLNAVPISGKKVALFCCHAGGKGNIMEKFKALLPDNNFTGEIDFHAPAKAKSAGNEAEQLKEQLAGWVKGIV